MQGSGYRTKGYCDDYYYEIALHSGGVNYELPGIGGVALRQDSATWANADVETIDIPAAGNCAVGEWNLVQRGLSAYQPLP